jgi:peroxiredoxin (alkyl hydroperoxide reductase subunit C)
MENEMITQMPRIGDMAPDFEAETTTGKLKFSEYNKGSWVVFFFTSCRFHTSMYNRNEWLC